MTEAERILSPLREREAAIEKLDTYASAGELADAIASVHAALERSIRMMLRADATAPESDRMAALAEATPLDAVVTSLRRRDRLSMQLAGRLHEADTVARRVAEGGEARAADADVLSSAVQLLRAEVRGSAESTPAPPSAGIPFALEEAPEASEPVEESSRSVLLFAILLILAAVAVGVLVVRARAGGGERRAAVEAFAAGDLETARTGFEAVLADDPSDVTTLLFLGRIHRREGRQREAAAVLREAATLAPGDADVRRELGWLFLDLGRPEAAVEQFGLARDVEPSDPSNWIGLVRALREAGDPSAAEVLRQAPPEAQAALGTAAR